MHSRVRKTALAISNCGYILGCSALFLIGLWIIFYALITAVIDVRQGTYEIHALLDDVGLLVFSIAVLDVSKYLLIEEVMKPGEERHPEEIKNSLTKFVSIVIQGTPGVLSFVNKEDLRAFVELTNMPPGNHEKEIQVKIPPNTVLIETFPQKGNIHISNRKKVN